MTATTIIRVRDDFSSGMLCSAGMVLRSNLQTPVLDSNLTAHVPICESDKPTSYLAPRDLPFYEQAFYESLGAAPLRRFWYGWGDIGTLLCYFAFRACRSKVTSNQTRYKYELSCSAARRM